MRLYFLTSGKG